MENQGNPPPGGENSKKTELFSHLIPNLGQKKKINKKLASKYTCKLLFNIISDLFSHSLVISVWFKDLH